jgi:hypothetical protein
MMTVTSLLTEWMKIVVGLDPAVPSGTTPDYVSLKGAGRLTIVILAKNTTTVTGSAIALKQATTVAAGSEKALAINSPVYRNIDTGAGDTLSALTVTNNTFNTDATNSKNSMYVLDVQEGDLDVTNNFDCVRVDTGNAVNATITILYLLWPVKYGRTSPPSFIVD